MDEIKRCERCGEEISNSNCVDWYSHIRIKYCPVCRKIVEREQANERMRNLRARKRLKEKFRDMELEQLKEITELQDKLIIKLREETN